MLQSIPDAAAVDDASLRQIYAAIALHAMLSRNNVNLLIANMAAVAEGAVTAADAVIAKMKEKRP